MFLIPEKVSTYRETQTQSQKTETKNYSFLICFQLENFLMAFFFFYIEEFVLRFGICFKSVGVWKCINLLSLPPFLQQTDKGFDRAAFESQMSVMRGQVGHCLILFIKNVRLESYQLSPTVTRSVAPHATCNAEPRQLRRYLVLV